MIAKHKALKSKHLVEHRVGKAVQGLLTHWNKFLSAMTTPDTLK